MRPYPEYLVRSVRLADGATIVMRPITPDDAAIEQEFVRNLSVESRYFRFMEPLRELSPRMLSPFTQVGVARYIVAPDSVSCEFAVVVADGWQRRGVGMLLMDALMDAGRGRGLRCMYGDVLAANHKMLALTRRLGFRIGRHEDDPRLVRVEALL